MSDDVTPPGGLLPRLKRSHEHKWFMVQTKNAFEPIINPGQIADSGVLIDRTENVYRMVEYAYLACNCATVIKTKVTIKEEH